MPGYPLDLTPTAQVCSQCMPLVLKYSQTLPVLFEAPATADPVSSRSFDSVLQTPSASSEPTVEQVRYYELSLFILTSQVAPGSILVEDTAEPVKIKHLAASPITPAPSMKYTVSWKQEIQERKKMREKEARVSTADRWAGMPVWKRNILESRDKKKKEAEEAQRLAEEKAKSVPKWKKDLAERKAAKKVAVPLGVPAVSAVSGVSSGVSAVPSAKSPAPTRRAVTEDLDHMKRVVCHAMPCRSHRVTVRRSA